MYRVLLAEDDEALGQAMKQCIQGWGLECERMEDPRDLMGQFRRFRPHLVLLDLALPFYNGYHWCREIRKESDVPVIFVSSAADDLNQVTALDLGADDFIAKPFAPGLLMAKIQSTLRRCYDYAAPAPCFTHRGAVFRPEEASLTYQGRTVELTKNDCRILRTLFERQGQVVSRDTLMMRLWETDSFIDENTLTVNVARLRRKLEAVGLAEFIVTKKGMGYMIE